MVQSSMKIVGWILGLLGLYSILALLVPSINFVPSILTGGWVSWVVSIVLLIVGGYMAFK